MDGESPEAGHFTELNAPPESEPFPKVCKTDGRLGGKINTQLQATRAVVDHSSE